MQVAAICKYILKYKHIDLFFLSLIVQNDSCIGKYVNFDDYNNVLNRYRETLFYSNHVQSYRAISIVILHEPNASISTCTNKSNCN